jgi:hypothetical protein
MSVSSREGAMSNFIKGALTEISRRAMIREVAIVGSAPFLAMSVNNAAAQPAPQLPPLPPGAKYTQAQVAYQDSPVGGQQCSQCIKFIKPRSCRTVEGIISPNGWCRAWTNVKHL